jgi:hypothetical protein
MHPSPFVCTQYQKFAELSVDAFHAKETLVSVAAVILRLLGVVGGRRSRAAAAGAATSVRTPTIAAAIPTEPKERNRVMMTSP